MTSSTFCRLLKDYISTETAVPDALCPRHQIEARCRNRRRTCQRYLNRKEYFNQHEFGEVEKVTFHHTKRNDYTKRVVVRMKTYDAVKKILAKDTHEIVGHRVCVEAVSESTQIKNPPFLKGPYKLKLTGLNTNLLDVKLNDRIEEAFADLGHHTAIELWKDTQTKELEGTAEIRFANKEDALEAMEIAIEEYQWGAVLFGPRDA